MAFSTKIKGHHHLQGNVQVYNLRIPERVALLPYSILSSGPRTGLYLSKFQQGDVMFHGMHAVHLHMLHVYMYIYVCVYAQLKEVCHRVLFM